MRVINFNYCEAAQDLLSQTYEKGVEMVKISEPHRNNNCSANGKAKIRPTATMREFEEMLSILVPDAIRGKLKI